MVPNTRTNEKMMLIHFNKHEDSPVKHQEREGSLEAHSPALGAEVSLITFLNIRAVEPTLIVF